MGRLDPLVLGWLAAGSDLSMVAGGLGLDPLAHAAADRGLLLRHKTGTDTGVRADVGLVEGPRAALAYAVLANWEPAAGDPRDAVLAAMREVGAALRARACG
jgi:beta-lactamase class A